jgi:hypothetical protein
MTRVWNSGSVCSIEGVRKTIFDFRMRRKSNVTLLRLKSSTAAHYY